MAKVKVYSIPKQERYQLVGEFFDIIAELKTKQEIIDFFIGLLTPSESLMLARRIQVAKSLTNEQNFREIIEDLHVSPRTVSTTYHWLHEKDGAYKKIIKRYLKKSNTNIISGRSNRKISSYPYNTSDLDKYPQHKLMKKILGL
jgi:uncharacterized protein YerC